MAPHLSLQVVATSSMFHAHSGLMAHTKHVTSVATYGRQ